MRTKEILVFLSPSPAKELVESYWYGHGRLLSSSRALTKNSNIGFTHLPKSGVLVTSTVGKVYYFYTREKKPLFKVASF